MDFKLLLPLPGSW